MEEAFLNKIHQVRIESELEATEKGAFDGCVIHHNCGQLEAFLREEVGEILENKLLRDVTD